MQKTQDITIVMLLMTAAILTSLLVAGYLYTEPAYAGSVSRSGDYVMASGMFEEGTDFVYVLDIANAKLNLYYANTASNQLTLGCTTDLSTAFR